MVMKNQKTYTKTSLLTILILFSFIFQSCLQMFVSENKYENWAKEYLEENFNDSFVYESISSNTKKDQYLVKFKAASLNNKTVTVKIDITESKMFSMNTSFTSNYLSLKFEEQEKSYYQDFFKKYFDDCKIQINNSNRFLHYYATYYTKESDSDEWIDHTDKNPVFKQYISLVNDSEFKNCMTIAVTQKEANQYITTEDSLKAVLMDLQHEEIKLDGNFYVVKTLDDDYTKNHTFAAKIDGYIYSDKTNHLGGHYKYKYTKF